MGKIETELSRHDMDLWFPERLTYDFLVKEKKKDKDGFAIKYLNNPRQIHRVKFTRELMMRRTIPHNQMPPTGLIVTAIDTAYSIKSWADYTVILTALIYGGRFYIINMVRGRFNEYDLPKVIASTAFKWKPKRIAIEDSVGVKWINRELRREMDRLGISIPIEYVSLGSGSKLRSKQMKSKPVLRLMGDERLYFLNSCEGLQEIYSELEKFTGTGDAHDDIVSAISLLCEQFGAYATMDQKITLTTTQYSADQQSRERHDLIYGLNKYRYLNASQMDDNPVTAFQAQNSPLSQDDPYSDPLADLFS
jgi:predicted phage terminase large subunit-like protein